MPIEIAATIESLAEAGISSASVDGRTATATPIKDLIEADKYLKTLAAQAKTGAGSGWGGVLRPAKAVPPGAI